METNKRWKRVPFDLELAKKITNGEVEGRFVNRNGDMVRIVGYDLFDGERNYIAAIMSNPLGHQHLTKHAIDGSSYEYSGLDLFIELSEEEPNHKFKPFDKVLVRLHFASSDNKVEMNYWCPAFFQNYANTEEFKDLLYHASGRYWNECIPYGGNEHLLGTTDNPE